MTTRPSVRREEAGTVVWDCPTCGQVASLDDEGCRACGTSLAAALAPGGGDPAGATGHDRRALVALTVVLPGAGHLAAGRVGSGLARALLYAVWLSGGVALAAAPSGHGAVVAAPLLLGAFALWLVSLVDALGLPAGARQIAEGRLLLWLVVGVTGTTLLSAMAAAATVTAGRGSP